MPQWIKDWCKAIAIVFRGLYGKSTIGIITFVWGSPFIYQRLRSNVGAFDMGNLTIWPTEIPGGYIKTMWEIAIPLVLIILLVSSLRWIVKTRAQVKGAWYQLAVLREKGVGLRNDGARVDLKNYNYIEVRDQNSFLEWKTMTEKWYENVKTEVAKISEADAVWFGIMDTIPDRPRVHYDPLQIDGYNYKLALILHDERLNRLGQMISPLVGSRLRGADK